MGFISSLEDERASNGVKSNKNMLFVFLRVASVHALFLPKQLPIVPVPVQCMIKLKSVMYCIFVLGENENSRKQT